MRFRFLYKYRDMNLNVGADIIRLFLFTFVFTNGIDVLLFAGDETPSLQFVALYFCRERLPSRSICNVCVKLWNAEAAFPTLYHVTLRV